MREGIHPPYKEANVKCGCGNTFKTGSTKETILVEICSNCHPFYTGKQKFVDTAGMVERFQRKWTSDAAKQAKEKAAAKPVKTAPEYRPSIRGPKTLQSQLPGPGPASLAPAVSQKAARGEPKPPAKPPSPAKPS